MYIYLIYTIYYIYTILNINNFYIQQQCAIKKNYITLLVFNICGKNGGVL